MSQLCLLGMPSLWHEGIQETLPLNTPSSLLFYLVVKGDWVSRSELAFLYKPDETETEALKYLRLQLHRAQQYPWASGLEVEKQQLRWLVDCDVIAFRKAIQDQDWLEAIDTYKDSFFGNHSYKDLPTYSAWVDLERQTLEQSYRQALNKQMTVYELEQHYTQAAELSAKLLKLDDLDEEVLQQHLQHLALSGQKEHALQGYAHFKKRLLEDLDSEPSEETQSLIKHIQNDEPISLKITQQTKHNLPNPSTRFIGRKQELLELKKQLNKPECRLLSLIGLGGSGKSRLGIELARTQLSHYKDGVYLIELAALDSEDAVLSHLAQTLGLQLNPKDPPKTQILNVLRNKQILLVFDNFEHVLTLAPLLNDILAISEKIKLIVTSRESLKLKSETIYDVEGLNYPQLSSYSEIQAELTNTKSENNKQSKNTLEGLENNEAVSLFLSAAKRVQPQLEASSDDLLNIARIAKQVEGLPLALELAASWVRIMPIARIAQELSQGYDLLEAELSDIPERHRNLRSILDKTWESLSEKKRQTLAKLSVFVGGCTLEAAEEVTQSHFSILLSLINEALLRRSAKGRLDLHMLIKSFGSEKLKRFDALSTTRQNHARYYAGRLAAHSSPSANKSALHLSDDTENCRAAWLYLTEQQQLDLLESGLNGIDYLYSMSGRYREGNQLYEESLGMLEAQHPSSQRDRLMAGIINGQADRSLTLGHTGLATMQLQKSLALLTPLKHVEQQKAYILSSFGRLCWEQGNYAQAQHYLQQAYDTVKPLDDRRHMVNILHGLAIVLRDQGKPEEARPIYQNVIEAYLSMAESGNAALAYNNLASLELALNQVDCAIVSIERGLALIKATQAARAKTYLLQVYAGAHFQKADYPTAEKIFLEVLELAHSIQDKTIICDVLNMLGHCQIKQGQLAKAIPYLQDSLRTAQELQSPPKLLATLTVFAEGLQIAMPERSYELLQIVMQHPACRGDIRKQAEGLSRTLPEVYPNLTLEAALDFLAGIH